MRYTPRLTRITRLHNMDIYRVEVLERRWFDWKPRWRPETYFDFDTLSLRTFECSYEHAVKRRECLKAYETEKMYRVAGNWIVQNQD